jgi:amidase
LSLQYYLEQFSRTGEPEVPSLKATGLLSITGTTLKGFFDLNVRRAEAAKTYLRLFRDNDLDAILMPPAPHTAVPLDTWTTITYTGIWNYLDYPAVVIPVSNVQESDLVDDKSNAKYGPEDSKVYNLCMRNYISLFLSQEHRANVFFLSDTGPELYKDAPVCVQVVGYRHADEALMNTVAVLDSIIHGE